MIETEIRRKNRPNQWEINQAKIQEHIIKNCPNILKKEQKRIIGLKLFTDKVKIGSPGEDGIEKRYRLKTLGAIQGIAKEVGYRKVLLTKINDNMPILTDNYALFPRDYIAPLDTLSHTSSDPSKTNAFIRKGLELFFKQDMQLIDGENSNNFLELVDIEEKIYNTNGREQEDLFMKNSAYINDISNLIKTRATDQFVSKIINEKKDAALDVAIVEVFTYILQYGVEKVLRQDSNLKFETALKNRYSGIFDEKNIKKILTQEANIRNELREAYKKQLI